jgi:LacI family transcriptional regulator
MKRATIKDVAKRAKVSRATIDRVIYDRGYVSKEKRKAVIEAIKALNFTPNRAAQALAKRKKCTIAVIYPTAERYFWNEVESGIDAAAREYENSGLAVVKHGIDKFDIEKQKDLLEQAANNGVDGVAIAPAHVSKLNALISRLSDKNIPVVTFNHDAPKSRRLSYIGQDLTRSGELAADLMALFLQNKGEVAILRHRSGVLEREGGFTRKVGQEYPEIDIIGHFNCEQSDRKAYAITRSLCKENPNLDGLFVTNAYVFIVGRAVQESGIGKKITVIGFDMTKETEQLIRDGTIDAVITQEPFRQGYEPIKIIHDFLYKGEMPQNRIVHTKSEIILRGNV